MVKSGQTLILVDNEDCAIGYASREVCHKGKGKKHRGFTTALFNGKGQILLQKRKHGLFDGLWDLTATSHSLHLKGADETYQQASDRALRREMGIGPVGTRNVGGFTYFVREGANCENEYCAILTGSFEGKFKPNQNEIYEAKWVNFEDFVADIGKNPKKYTPWAVLTVKRLKGQNPNLLNRELSLFLASFEPLARAYFQRKIKETKKYSPVISNMYRDLENFQEGGKKLRAYLVWLGFRVGGGNNLIQVLPISLAVEIFHSFLLIHDDIIDKSDFRHGKPTIHKQYEKAYGTQFGISKAIIMGDFFCFDAFLLIADSNFPAEVKIECQKEIVTVLTQTGWGEALDLEYSFSGAKLADILAVADLKTARYSFVGPLTVGAKLARANKPAMAALEKYGLAVGLAFQIQDDILGVFGDEKTLGKPVLSDMREGKNTLLIHKARQLAGERDRKSLSRLWGKSDADSGDLEKVKAIVGISGAMMWCESENQRLVGAAKRQIEKISRDPRLQAELAQIADYVISRQK